MTNCLSCGQRFAVKPEHVRRLTEPDGGEHLPVEDMLRWNEAYVAAALLQSPALTPPHAAIGGTLPEATVFDSSVASDAAGVPATIQASHASQPHRPPALDPHEALVAGIVRPERPRKASGRDVARRLRRTRNQRVITFLTIALIVLSLTFATVVILLVLHQRGYFMSAPANNPQPVPQISCPLKPWA